MCGIVGIFAYHDSAPSVKREELRCIRDHMAARGPDGKGEWYSEDGRVGFAHRRLSIIDLSNAGAQPMVSADRNRVVTFNGEIYNHGELRDVLEAKGYVFSSRTDTEVLLHLYAEKGEAMVHDLRGMFAFALWDAENLTLLLARDPYGIKPLYYADDGRTLRFASQVEALMAGGMISTDAEPAGWVGFNLFGFVPEPYTTFREIKVLPAGTTQRVDCHGLQEQKRFFSIAGTYFEAEKTSRPVSDGELQHRVREALVASVRDHLVADVPVGAFLSAGVDSGALVGLMRDAGQQDIRTVTLAFKEFKGTHDDETPIAEEVAAHYDTSHHTRIVTEQEFNDDLPKILEAMDQPTIDGINTWFVSKAARELGLKAAVSGLGGDELFGGYASFRQIPRWVRVFSVPSHIPMLGNAFSHVVAGLNELFPALSPKAGGLLKYGGTYAGAYLLRRGLFLPWELESVMDRDMAIEGLRRLEPLQHLADVLCPMPRTAFGRVATLEASVYMRNQLLRDTDWSSMAHSLEVRVPLVDAHLLKRLAPITPSIKKTSGKTLLAGSPTIKLPSYVTNRTKTGFQTPIEDWLVRSEHPRNVKGMQTSHWSRRWATTLMSMNRDLHATDSPSL